MEDIIVKPIEPIASAESVERNPQSRRTHQLKRK